MVLEAAVCFVGGMGSLVVAMVILWVHHRQYKQSERAMSLKTVQEMDERWGYTIRYFTRVVILKETETEKERINLATAVANMLCEIITYRKENTIIEAHVKLFLGPFLRGISESTMAQNLINASLNKDERLEVSKLLKASHKWCP